MDEEASVKPVKRHFGNTLVVWKIRNFCFETCRESLSISTPEFYVDGPYVTNWKMSLRPKGKKLDDYAFLSVFERTESDKAPDIICADLNFWMLDSEGKWINFVRHKSRFRRNDRQEITLWSITRVRDALKVKALTHVTLSIFFQVIVTFEECHRSIEEPSDPAIKALSEDFLNMLKAGDDYDFTFRCRGNEIRAHKVMLFTQTLDFYEKIMPESNVITMHGVDDETMRDLIEFYYTRNIDCIARNPSVLMIQYAAAWNLMQIKYYYDSHTLDIETTINIRERTILWRKGCIHWSFGELSPLLTSFKGSMFRIYLSDTIDGIGVHYLSIFVQVVEGTLPRYGCLQISILEDNKEMYSRRMKLPGVSFKGYIGFETFITAIEYNKLCQEISIDDLNIALKIEEHDDTAYSCDKYTASKSALPADKYYECLVKHMKFHLKNHLFSDMTIQTEGVDTSIEVHKCILSARSPVLGTLIKQMTGGTLIIRGMKFPVLQFVIHFLYTGVCDDDVAVNESFLLEVYRAAEELAIPSLKQKCLTDMLEDFNTHFVCEVLMYSETHNDIELQNAALKSIYENKDVFFDDQNWKSWLDSKPCLCDKILEYVKDKDESLAE